MQKGEQKINIRRGLDEMMFGGDLGRFGSPRVDNNKFSAPIFNMFKALRNASRGHNAAITGERVCPQDNHMVRAVDIGDRNSKFMSKHEMRRKVMRELIHRGRGEDVFTTNGFSQCFDE